MKIVADSSIPFLKGVFEPYADVVFKDGRLICRDDLTDAEVLVIRTRTRCDAALLEGTSVRMIAIAAIGVDHIDFDYCNRRGIEVHNAQGCNAGGVMQYVLSAIYGVASRKGISLDGATMGIIGVGNVGTTVAAAAARLGFRLLLCDPPRAASEPDGGFCSLDYLLENSQIVTMHTPLDESTRRMADASFFAKMRPGTIFVNTSRGEVVDDNALKAARPKLGGLVIDTWNDEPDVDAELVDMTDIATPHIAGYSFQGKLNAAAAAVRCVAERYGIEALMDYDPDPEAEHHKPVHLDLADRTQGEITSIFQYNYPIFTDDFMFRVDPGNFEKMRADYSYRREIIID